MSNSNRRKVPLPTAVVYAMNVLVAMIIAAFCFCPIGAFVPRKRRNPAAKIGLPEMVIKEKARTLKKTIALCELYDD